MRQHPDIIRTEDSSNPFETLIVRTNVDPENPNIIVQGPFFGFVEIENAFHLTTIISTGMSLFASSAKPPSRSLIGGATARENV